MVALDRFGFSLGSLVKAKIIVVMLAAGRRHGAKAALVFGACDFAAAQALARPRNFNQLSEEKNKLCLPLLPVLKGSIERDLKL